MCERERERVREGIDSRTDTQTHTHMHMHTHSLWHVCVECLFLTSPLQDSFGVRQKGDLLGTPPRSPSPRIHCCPGVLYRGSIARVELSQVNNTPSSLHCRSRLGRHVVFGERLPYRVFGKIAVRPVAEGLFPRDLARTKIPGTK